jgi:hypothetical protein
MISTFPSTICDKSSASYARTLAQYSVSVYNKPEGEKKKFAVCVKGMDFPEDDLSVRLVEWILLLNTLGADKIFLYNLEVQRNNKNGHINSEITKILSRFLITTPA